MLFGSKKVKKEKVGKDIEFDSVLDLDADMDDLGLGKSTASSKIKNFNVGFHRGFNTDINRKHALNGLMAGALPDEYAHLYRAGLDVNHIVREDIRQAREANADVLLSMVERTERMLPKVRRFTPKRVYDRFEDNLQKSRESLREEVESKRARERGTVSSDLDEDTITSALMEVTAYSDARSESREQDNYLKESVQRTLQAEVERTRFGTTTEQLGTIASNLERQSAFQDSITYRFQRKSLEVQYRSLFMLRDMRKLTGANLDLQRRGFEALVHNSSLTSAQLPQHAIRTFKNDHLTALAKEAGVANAAPAFSYGNAVRQGLTFGVTTSAREKLPAFLSKYSATARKNIQRGISDLLSGMDTVYDSAESSGEMGGGLSGDDRANMGGQGIGATLGRLFGTYVAPRMGRYARPGMDRINGQLGGRGHLASYWINNLPSIFQDFSRNQSSEDSGLMGLLRGGVRAMTPSYYRETEIEDGSYQTIDRETSFNHLSQRSLVEVIPGYLSRMLHEARMLRTGDTSIEREVYDVTKGQFTTTKAARQSLKNRLVPEGQRDNVTTTLDGIMNTYLGDDSLSEEAKFALREQLMQDAGSGGRFDPEKYAAGGFDASTPDETVKELTDFFKRQFKYDDDGKLVREYENLRQLDEYAQEFSRLRDIMPDPREEIARLHGAGSQELMRDLGITYTRNGRDYTDFSQIWKMYRGDDDVIGDAEQPLPNRPDRFASQGSSTTIGIPDVMNDHFTDHLTKLFADTQQHLNDAMNRVSEKLCDHPIFYEKCCDPCDDPKKRRKKVKARAEEPRDTAVDTDIHRVEVDAKDPSNTPKWHARLKVTDGIKSRFARTRKVTSRDLGESTIPTNERTSGEESETSKQREHSNRQGTKPTSPPEPKAAKAGPFREFYQRTKDNVSDLFTRKGNRTLLKRDLLAGLYIDKRSQKVIYDIKGIHGEVIDRDGNVILTEAEYRDGLFDVTAMPVQTRSHLNELLGSDPTRKGRLGGVKETLTNLRDRVKQANATRQAIGKAFGDFFNHDAYMPGEETPRIRIVAMKDGEYTNRKGSVVRRLSDIRGTIFDKDLNVVVSEDDLPRLITIQGRPHPIAKNTKGLGRLLSKGAQVAGRYLDWTKNYYKKLPGRLLRAGKGTYTTLRHPIRTALGMDEETPTVMEGLGKRAGQVVRKTRNMFDIGMNDGRNLSPTAVNPGASYDNEDEIDPRDLKWMKDGDRPVDDDAIKTPTDGLLNRINETLERAYPDPHRKGSWQQILADRRAKREAEEKAAKVDKGEEKPFANVFDQMKDAFGGLKDMFSKGAGGLMGMLGLGDGTPVVLGNPLGGGGANNPPKRAGFLKRTAQAIARYGWIGAAFLGKGALAAGTATVATVGLPAIAGAAAVAGVVGGGIYLWNRHQETSGALYRWRFSQYGIDPEDRDQAIPVLALEKHIEELTTRNNPNDIGVDLARLDTEQLSELFELGNADQERIDEFNKWFRERFLPIYLAHQRSLVTISPSVKLTEIDRALDKEDGEGFIDAVVVPRTMLTVMASPFGIDAPLTVDDDQIQSYLETAKRVYNTVRAVRNRRRRNAGPGQGHREAQRTTPETPEAEPTSGQGTRRRWWQRRQSTTVPTPEISTQAIEAARSVVDVRLRSSIHTPLRRTVPSPLQAMRLHAYGLDRMDTPWSSTLLTLEEKVMEYVTINRNHQAEFNGNANTHLREIADLLGIVWSEDREDAQKWRYWFVSRFLPVVLAYVSKMHHVAPSAALGASGTALSKEQRLSVARAIMGAQSQRDEETLPVWDIITEVFLDHDRYSAESQAQNIVLTLEDAARKTETPVGHTPESLRQRQQQQTEMERRVTQGSGNQPPSINHYQDYIQTRRQITNGGIDSRALGLAGNTSPLPPGGQAGPRGNAYGGLAEGNGGAWEDLPIPTKDQDREAAMPTLRGVQEMTGVDADLLATFAKIESNFRATVKASTSSATGWFQFLNATWDEMIDKYGAKYGIPTDLPQAQRRELRKDPRINALMGAEFLKGNHRYLSRTVGREPTDTDLYLAHFMGMGGAQKVLTADMNARADQLFPAPANSNPTVFYHGGDRSRPRTIAELIQWADSKVAPGRAEGSGGGNVFSATTPDSATAAPTPQVDVGGVDALYNREVVQVAPDGASGAYQFADESEAATEVSENLARSNQARRSTPGVDPSGSVVAAAGAPTTTPNFATVEEEVAEVIQPQQQRRQQVLETERRQRERLEESVVETQAMGSIAQQQLETQREMRDYLMQMASSMGIIQEKGLKINKEDESDRPSNDTSVPPAQPPSRQRQTGNANAPVSMSSN